MQTGRTLDARTSLILRYLYQDTNVFNIEVPIDELDRQYRTYAVSGPSASVIFDTRDDPLEPKRGLFLGADLQLSLEALGGVSYLRGFFQATSVRRLRADLVFVLSARARPRRAPSAASRRSCRCPSASSPAATTAPAGFPVDGVGPKLVGTDGQLYPTGGNALAARRGGAALQPHARLPARELPRHRQRLSRRRATSPSPQLRWSAGLGLRYRTPIGPVRLDWGYVLDPQPGDEERSHFHLSIGHAF